MSVKKKKRILNIIMVLLLLVIAASAVLAVGSVKGWFARKQSAPVKAAYTKGIVNLQRGGIVYALEEDSAIQAGDALETRRLASAAFSLEEDSSIVMNENSAIRWDAVSEEGAFLSLEEGEIFGDTWQYHKEASFSFAGGKSGISHAVFSAGTLHGSNFLYVYVGDLIVELPDGDVARMETGDALLVLPGEGTKEQIQIYPLQVSSLSDFQIEQLLGCASLEETCFTREALLEVLADREAQKKAALEAALLEPVTEALTEAATQELTQEPTEEMTEGITERETWEKTDLAAYGDYADDAEGLFAEDGSQGGATGTSQGGGGQSGGGSPSPAGNAFDNYDDTMGDAFAEPAGNTPGNGASAQAAAPQQTAPAAPRCTIEIRCDTILDNMENLTEGKEVYVPANGVILSTSTVEFSDGETVFDVLTRVCSAAGIQIEYSWTPMYDSYYIEGMNHLYEFDCGNESGWMYKVNGWFPNYGCSSYTLNDGDVIVWCYTCNGLGADVGGQAY